MRKSGPKIDMINRGLQTCNLKNFLLKFKNQSNSQKIKVDTFVVHLCHIIELFFSEHWQKILAKANNIHLLNHQTLELKCLYQKRSKYYMNITHTQDDVIIEKIKPE